MKDVVSAINAIDSYIDEQSNVEKYKLEYGSYCEEASIDKLVHYKNLLQRFLTKNTCIKETYKLTNLVKNVLGMLPKFSYTYNYIEDNDIWVSNNPGCVNYKTWEASLYETCTLPKLEISSIPQEVRLFSYEIEATTKECELLFDVYATVQKCNKASDFISISSVEKECKNNLKIYSHSSKDCSINLDVYSELTNCNLSYEAFNEVINCGIAVETYTELRNCNIDVRYDAKEQCLTFNKE